MDGLKRYVNDDRFRVDGDKNMRLLAFAFTIVFVWTGSEMQCGAFCDTILGDVTVCALISSSLDDFSDIVPCMTVMITIFFLSGGREAGHFFGGEAFTPQIP